MSDIVIVGASGHAGVVIDIIERQGSHRIVGLVDEIPQRDEHIHGYPVLADDAHCREVCQPLGVKHAIVAIGDNARRSRVVGQLAELFPDLQYVRAIHPTANLARGVTVGAGSVVMAGACINANTQVGAHCIVNTLSCLEHDCRLGDFASMAPASVCGGNCQVGAYTAIGIGATVIHGIEIGPQSVIGAGATVLNNVEPLSVSYGTPARVIRLRQSGEGYL